MKLLIVSAALIAMFILNACSGKESTIAPATSTSGGSVQATSVSPSTTALSLNILSPQDQSVVGTSTIIIR